MIHKKVKVLLGTMALTSMVYAQQPQTGTPGNSSDWRRGGNLAAPPGLGGTNNIFGTMWNSPIYTYTNGVQRMRLNGSLNYSVNAYPAQSKDGYLLLGQTSQASSQIFNNNNFGAFSMLHLNGSDNGTGVLQQGGHKPWMQTGITLTENGDMSYFGLRTILPDLTETVISWSEIQSNIVPPGQDDMVFRMTAGGGTSNDANIIGNLQSTTDLDGLHVARFTGFGHFALGNTFGTTQVPSPYVRPESHFHMSHHAYSPIDRQWGFMQITYRDLTGETANDGLRFGIDRVQANPHGFLRWQENTAFIFQTDWDNTAGGIENGERLRLTTVGQTGIVPVGTTGANITRVGISELGNQPITTPRSLLHLGFDVPLIAGLTGGWRNWMDIGTFTSSGSDNMYVGLKYEGASDRYDAVVNWGDNQALNSAGPDQLRFIFTSPTGLIGDPVSQSQDGLEIARMDPRKASTLPNTNFGMVGIGNFAGVNAPGTAGQMDAKLDIDGDLRIREVTQDNSLTQVLVIDPNDYNRVHYADINIPTGGNGFIVCSDTSNAAYLTADSKINLNDQQLYFENNNAFGQNHTGFGYDCGSALPAKVSVEQIHPTTVSESSTAISGINSDVTNGVFKTYTGVYGQATELQNINLRPIMVGGDFTAANGSLNMGVRATLTNSQQANETNFGFYSLIEDDNSSINYGSHNTARNAVRNVGVHGQVGALPNTPAQLGHGGRFISWSHSLQNVGVEGNVASISNYGFQNFGVAGVAGSGTNNYAIYGDIQNPGSNNYAGYFNGSVVFTGGAVLVSDSTFKENIAPIDDMADSLLMLVKPYSYEYVQTGNAERLRLDEGTKYGILAQQIEPYFPHMVKEVTHPAKFDSLGNILDSSFTYKAVDLTQLIPVMLFDLQKKNSALAIQNNNVDSLQNALDEAGNQLLDLNNRLTQLENCLSGILPFLCQLSNTAIEQNNTDVQNQLIKTLNVELSNKDNIVLNQNVPNPFAESTVITFSIPESVQKAQIHFYDGTGKLINSVEINERGAGRLNVFGSDLSTGVYTYSLVADGQVVSTKRMMKQ